VFWVGQAIAEMIASFVLQSSFGLETLFCAYGAIIGIIVTHLLRGTFLYKHKGEVTLPRLVLKMSWVSLGPSLLYSLLLIPLFMKYNPWDVEPGEELFTVIGMFFWGWFNMITWLALYFSAIYFINFQQASTEREQLNTALKDAELRALKSHLNPHFLFNALNSVRALVTEDPVRARDSITLLAKLLRTTLNTSKYETHPLYTEMDTVASYLNLELLRFEDRLQIHITVDPTLDMIQVPPLSVQTLVENALKHGIAPLENGGDISIDLKIDEQSLLVCVSNTGNIRTTSSETPGTGLENLRERLRLLFGQRASLTLREAEGRVFSEMRLPCP
jgi:LytS/YehU family sensor histidine kinase